MKPLHLLFAILFAVGIESRIGAAALSAAPRRFVTPEMTLRNGLTDAQYESLWAAGRNPRIDPQTARDWAYRAARFQNSTNWFHIIGRTNDYARLVVPTMTTNEQLRDANGKLVGETNRLEVALGAAEERAKAAEDDAKVTQTIRKASRRAEKNLQKVVKEIEKARSKASTEDEAALYSALLAILRDIPPNPALK